jgi:hypothetical protein
MKTVQSSSTMKQIQKKCATIDNGTKQTSITMKQTFIGMKHAQKEPFSEQSPMIGIQK